jgi:hypothetical protein
LYAEKVTICCIKGYKVQEEKQYNTNKKHYNFFITECKRYQKVLSLYDWQIYYSHMKNESNLAWCNANEDGANATISLNTDWSYTEPTNEELSRCAFHEVCELLLWKLDEMARIGCSPKRCNEERHAIIRRLENTVWKTLK